MPAKPVIKVEKENPGEFRVTITEGRSQSSHRVFLTQDYFRKLTNGSVSEKDLIERSFQFLLERESKESILPEFDLPVIGRYFPAYETEIRNRLGVPS